LRNLADHGQSVWLDFLSRDFIENGEFARRIESDGVSGATSNPSIFQKAIAHDGEYGEALASLLQVRDADPVALYEQLAIADIRSAADVLRPCYDASAGRDGFVSLEVSPYLAHDTEATVAEACRLWRMVERDNVMIKVPATPEGLPAIRRLIAEGININITLLFSQEVYEQVAEAYIGGVEDLIRGGGNARSIASVASFFVSRIDTEVDRLIDERLRSTADRSGREIIERLKGRIAVANAKLAYQRCLRIFSGERWETLAARGARTQRVLWASTGTKNPAYRDVLYVEELIGPDTINTMPPATLEAFRDHGAVRASLAENIDDAQQAMASLELAGISIDAVTAKLVEDGVRLFADAFDELLAAVARRRAQFLDHALDSQRLVLPESLQGEHAAMLEAWRKSGTLRRLWSGDARVWSAADEAHWLGWLRVADDARASVDELQQFAAELQQARFKHVVLLGMGGSSLGPEVLARTFGPQTGHPELLVLDTTDPAQIGTIERRIDLTRTLFIVASKSGGTLEPNILEQYFFERVRAVAGDEHAGSHFVAITDPGSSLQQLAERARFRRIFLGVPSIGGRYSVLSNFGLVPAAAMGLDVGRLLSAAQWMMRSCAASAPPAENPGALLGIALGLAAQGGRNKLTIVASPALSSFGAWVEQLLAESTGKQGLGVIPVDGEAPGAPEVYGADRFFACLRLDGESDPHTDELIAALERSGHPLVHIALRDRYQLGQEFFRWQMATAVAGAVLGINPFDQPDVEASKARTRELTERYETPGSLPSEQLLCEEHGIKIYADQRNAQALAGKADGQSAADVLARHFERLDAGDYCALLAYLERGRRFSETLQRIRLLIRDRMRVATCLEFGPRFLHSTGQAYNGGPNSGVFLQITGDDSRDIRIQGRKNTFGLVKAAQAQGDFDVLVERGRRALRIHIEGDTAAGLQVLKKLVQQALKSIAAGGSISQARRPF
jgi:transaldolase / glucose-6-phosphate isomerase